MRSLFLFLCLVFPFLAQSANAGEMPDPAPLFAATLTDLDGKAVAMKDLRGKPLLVNFWARWCGPCRVEIPELTKVQRQMKDKGLVVVGIGLEDKSETVREFARAYEMEYTVLLAKDQGLPLLRALGNMKAALPYTLAIDRNGKVVSTKLGLMTKADIDAALARLY